MAGCGVESPDVEEVELFLWEYTDEFGKRRVSRWLMTEQDAARYKDAVKVAGSREVRRSLGSTSDFLRSPKKS